MQGFFIVVNNEREEINEGVMLVRPFPEEVIKMARPSKYHTHVQPKLETITGWARQGLSHEQIARNLNVAESTFYEYKKMYPELSEALRRGEEDAVLEVENALFKSAIGFTYTEDALTKTGQVVEVNKYAKPNVSAIIFFLKNKRPNQWKDKQEIQADVNQCVIFEGEDDIKD